VTTPTSRSALNRAPLFVLAAVTVLAFAVSAAAQSLSPERRKAIETLLDVTGAVHHARHAAETTAGEALVTLTRVKPHIPPRAVELTREVFGTALDEFLDSPDGVLPLLVAVYANHYTHDEIIELTAFYRTPLGQKVAATQPLLTRETSNLMEKQFQRRLPQIMQTLQARLKEEGIVP
jgi:hypothetical protein